MNAVSATTVLQLETKPGEVFKDVDVALVVNNFFMGVSVETADFVISEDGIFSVLDNVEVGTLENTDFDSADVDKLSIVILEDVGWEDILTGLEVLVFASVVDNLAAVDAIDDDIGVWLVVLGNFDVSATIVVND